MLFKIHNILISFEIIKYPNMKNQEENLFYNENQFIKYIKVSLRNIYLDYLRKTKIELLENNDLIEDKENNSLKNMSFDQLSDEERAFINLFIEDKKIISERKVGEKLGISQQAVHKKVVKIRQKMLK